MTKCTKCGIEGDYACSNTGCPGAVRHRVFWSKTLEAGANPVMGPEGHQTTRQLPTLEQQVSELRGTVKALQDEMRQLNRQLLELSLSASLRMGK
jgi:TolA-binding protein